VRTSVVHDPVPPASAAASEIASEADIDNGARDAPFVAESQLQVQLLTAIVSIVDQLRPSEKNDPPYQTLELVL
jgi:hypothetical protein